MKLYDDFINEWKDNPTEDELTRIRDMFQRKDLFHIFIMNHLSHYPKERINNDLGEPSTKLLDILEQLKKDVSSGKFANLNIYRDMLKFVPEGETENSNYEEWVEEKRNPI
jgi:hypothetical protein